MKYLLIMIIMIPQITLAVRRNTSKSSSSSFSSRSSDHGLFRIQGSYGVALVDTTDLDNFRKQFIWNGSNATDGTFSRLPQTDFGIGVRIGPGHLMVHYFTARQDLKNTDIGATGVAVKDSFNYAATYVFYDVPFNFGDFLLTTGLGIGKANKFEFHQALTGGNGEDITWSDVPTGYRARASLGYTFSNTFGVYLELGYEMMKSTLNSANDYQTTINGVPIRSGQKLTNRGNSVEADLSGGRMAAGLMVMF